MSTKYLATINTPGYLPMDDEPPVFDTAVEAWEYLADVRRESEDEYPDWADHDCSTPSACDYSNTLGELVVHASDAWLVCDFERVGTVYGSTPGYEGEHDLGLAYSVTELEN